MSRFNVDNYAKFKIDVVYYQDVKDKSKIYAVEIDMATPQDIQVLTAKNQPTLKLDTDDYISLWVYHAEGATIAMGQHVTQWWASFMGTI